MNLFIRTFLFCLSQYFSTNIFVTYPVHQGVHEIELFLSLIDCMNKFRFQTHLIVSLDLSYSRNMHFVVILISSLLERTP